MIQQSPTEERTDTVAFVQEWLMNADYDPSQFDRDFAAAIDARCAALSQAAQPAEADGVEPFAWMLRHKTTGEPYWDEDMCVWSDRWDAEDRAEHEDEYEAVPVFVTTPKAPATDAGEVERLVAIVQHEAQNGAPTPVDYGDAEQIVRAILAALATPPAPNDDLRAENERLRAWIEKDAARFDHCSDMMNSSFNIAGTLRAERTVKMQHYANEARAALKENRRG